MFFKKVTYIGIVILQLFGSTRQNIDMKKNYIHSHIFPLYKLLLHINYCSDELIVTKILEHNEPITNQKKHITKANTWKKPINFLLIPPIFPHHHNTHETHNTPEPGKHYTTPPQPQVPPRPTFFHLHQVSHALLTLCYGPLPHSSSSLLPRCTSASSDNFPTHDVRARDTLLCLWEDTQKERVWRHLELSRCAKKKKCIDGKYVYGMTIIKQNVHIGLSYGYY